MSQCAFFLGTQDVVIDYPFTRFLVDIVKISTKIPQLIIIHQPIVLICFDFDKECTTIAQMLIYL